MEQFRSAFAPFSGRMKTENLPEIFINSFQEYFNQLASGATGVIPESEISPVDSLPDFQNLPEQLAIVGHHALPQTVVIKLNGGLGTGMGLEKAKSLLSVKNNLSFLDIIAKQMIQGGVSLLLMNSFATEADSLELLLRYPQLENKLPLSFLQHKEPKIFVEDLLPVEWPENPELEWCPPGHGDIYTALVTRNILSSLLENHYRYAFVSNADNLGAVLDLNLLGYFVENQLPFMMEVTDRTAIDRKGGHLAIRKADGRLILRETAQCAVEDMGDFQDISRYKYFNTNNLWLNLHALSTAMDGQNNHLGLPLIRNMKTVDPTDASSPPVYQLETAMGSAITIFPKAQAVWVPRNRFAPVKKTNDLLAIRSDAYVLTSDYRIVLSPQRRGDPPIIDLDARYYQFISDLDARFPEGPPSLVNCDYLKITGDVRFEKGVICSGEVILENHSTKQITIREGTHLKG